jgi:hypothetical protein
LLITDRANQVAQSLAEILAAIDHAGQVRIELEVWVLPMIGQDIGPW